MGICSSRPQKVTKNDGLIIAAYWASWRQEENKRRNIEYLNHLLYAFAIVQEDGSLQICDEKQFEGLLETSTVPVWLSIGGWNNRAALGKSIMEMNDLMVSAVALSQKYPKIFGFDIDWEPENIEKIILDNYAAFLNGLRKRLLSSVQLSIAVSASLCNHRQFFKDIQYSIAYFNLMAYDFSGPWSPTSMHHSGISDTLKLLHNLKDYYGKVLLGMPLYGRFFGNCQRLGARFSQKTTSSHPTIDYSQLITSNNKILRAHDGAYMILHSDTLVTFNDIWDVHKKIDEIVKAYGLAGVFFWELAGESIDAERSLIRAARFSSS